MSTCKATSIQNAPSELPVIEMFLERSIFESTSYIMALYSDQLLMLSVRKKMSIPSQAYERDGASVLLDLPEISKKLVIPIAEITSIQVAKLLHEVQAITIVTQNGKHELSGLPIAKGGAKFLQLLERHLPQSVQLTSQEPTKFKLFAMVPIILAAVFVGTLFKAREFDYAWCGVASLLALSIEVLWPRRTVKFIGGGAAVTRVEPPRDLQKKKLVLTKREPFRSKPLSVIFKLVSLGFVGVAICWGPTIFLALNERLQGWHFTVVWIIVFISLMALIRLPAQVAYWLAMPDARDVLRASPDNLILFLRSFNDDGQGDYNPDTLLAKLFRVRLGPEVSHVFPLIGVLHSICAYLRILFNQNASTAEEQLASFFNRHGVFAAVGRPGERFATPGANRMYVDHAEWQTVVKDLVAQAKIIVLQPGKGEGVWWEVKTVLKNSPPNHVLIGLLNLKSSPIDYRNFRDRVSEAGLLPLPASIDDVDFIYFSPDGVPGTIKIEYRSEVTWPVVNCAVDFDATLSPFFYSASSKPGEDFNPPIPRRRSKWSRFVQASLAVFIYCGIPLLLVGGFITYMIMTRFHG